MKKNKEQVLQLMESGFESLEALDYDHAIKIGKMLKKLRHSSAFEIIALAYAGKGRPRKAIKVLEYCVNRAPKAWRIWRLLGNFHSDQGNYQKAHEAYARAIDCPNSYESSVVLSKAIAFEKEGNIDQALIIIDQIVDEELVYHAGAVKLRVLDMAGRREEAAAIAEQLLRDIPDVGLAADVHAHLLALAGQALWTWKQDRERSMKLAMDAIELNRTEPVAMWLIREIMGLRSLDSNVYELVVEGEIMASVDAPSDSPGFAINCSVVAQTPDEALSFIRVFEPEEVRNTLKITSSKITKRKTDQPKGVYAISDYHF